ncbi:MAG: TonB family protein [Bacteroidota bacterium]|nr:TonB family protein [Bacteroidota bacterium]
METSQILQADVLDIIFDDRNKAYGAYELRRHYRARLTKAIGGMVLFTGLSLTTYLLLASEKTSQKQTLVGPDIFIAKVEPKEQVEKPPVTPPPPKEIVDVKTKMFTTIKIVPNEEVKENEAPPEQTDLDNVKIGNVNKDGKDFDGTMVPNEVENKGIVAAPKKENDDDIVFRKVEIESEYPGGTGAWAAFLNRRLDYPQEAIDQGVQGTVMIEFIVDKQGRVSNVIPISGPEELIKAAIAVIKQSGQWKPAIQNGIQVNSYKRQPITFRLPE